MAARETVSLYYDAWQNKRGDFSQVPSPTTSSSPVLSRASTAPRVTERWRVKPGQRY
jgi:hypothetical protein